MIGCALSGGGALRESLTLPVQAGSSTQASIPTPAPGLLERNWRQREEMVKIRLRRMGSRNHPYYRVVVSDSRKTPLAEALEEIGFYDPRREPSVFEIDKERYEHWRQNGAGVSETVRKLVARV